MLPLCPAPANTPRKTPLSTRTRHPWQHHNPTSTVPTGIKGRISKSRSAQTASHTWHSDGWDTRVWDKCTRQELEAGDNMCMAGGEWLWCWCSEHQHNKPCNSWLAGHRCTAGRAEGDKHNTFFFLAEKTKQKKRTYSRINPLGERLGSLHYNRRKLRTENISHLHYKSIRSQLLKNKNTKQTRAFPTGREDTTVCKRKPA